LSSTQGKIWYFAYGSSLNVDQMKTRIGQWQLSKRALVRNYRLAFNVYSKKRGGYVANIQATDNFEDTVLGVVYRITPEQLAALEKFEGIAASDVGAELEDGNEISHAKVFVWKTPEKEHEPSKDYRRIIEQGLLQHGYSELAVKKTFARFDALRAKVSS
jgi:cation transport regulator ChaC